MDKPNQIRIRSGKVFSERPQIITPNYFANSLLEGFGEKAQDYADWLETHGDLVLILKYGLQFRKEHISSEVVTDSLEAVIHKVKDATEERNNNFEAVIVGADELWEVSLFKFIKEYIERSAINNVQDINQMNLESSMEVEREIEHAFQMAMQDKSKVQELGDKLQRYGLFEKYEDRFYSLMKR